MHLGQIFELSFQFSQQQVNQFAEVTGDNNPIHSNEQYAALTPFKRPIMHGFLSASVFSRIFGTLYPGEGTIYMSQTMNFLKPMYVDTSYKAVLTVAEIFAEKHRARVTTEVLSPEGEKVISGEALVYHKEKI
ncbi:MAG: MaoC family dehydratase [Saprospirales bacterium]|nr:MaoC family dehydratase [Saprospirales bacterium]MBK6902985.1 MaoC family dehydratase [Saprospirales bacterium]MBK7337739.1 MaoC family dehydratase [Saprospirales bacterium]